MTNFENHPLHPGNGIPIFIAAGVLREAAQLEQFMRIEDPRIAPVLTLGGFTMHESFGVKPGQTDFVYYKDEGIAGNARRLPNSGKNGILALESSVKLLTSLGIKTIIQAAYQPHESPLEVLPVLAEIAASIEPTAVEIDLSCPTGEDASGKPHSPVSNNPELAGEIMDSSRARVGRGVTLGIKDSSHTSSIHEAIDEYELMELLGAVAPFTDFITGINTIGTRQFPEFVHSRGYGGMSGPIVAPVARQHLKLCRAFEPTIPYLSAGGVSSENAETEVPYRLEMGAILVGGAQEFVRTKSKAQLAIRWAVEAS